MRCYCICTLWSGDDTVAWTCFLPSGAPPPLCSFFSVSLPGSVLTLSLGPGSIPEPPLFLLYKHSLGGFIRFPHFNYYDIPMKSKSTVLRHLSRLSDAINNSHGDFNWASYSSTQTSADPKQKSELPCCPISSVQSLSHV